MTTPDPGSVAFDDSQGAYDWAKSQLAAWGLGGPIADVIINQVKLGTDPNTALLEIRKTPEYAARFPGNAQLLANGLPVLNEAQYLSKEDALRAQLSDPQYGLPKNFYDSPDDFGKIIGTGMGAGEIQTRLAAVRDVVTNGAMNGTLDYAQQHYGLSTGDLMAYYLDPDKAGGLLVQKQLNAAPIGAAAARTGFGDISTDQAEHLASLGITGQQAAAGFSDAAALGEIGKDVGTDKGVDKSTIISAEFDQNAAARAQIDAVRAKRLAEFQGGGGYASDSKGVSGLGSANT